jgi:hypothetical protein
MSDSNDLSLAEKADAAFRRVAARVLRQARATGTPIIVWEQDRVMAIPPDERWETGPAPSAPLGSRHPDR